MTAIGSSRDQRAERQAIRAHWRLFLIQGIVMILLGLFAIAAPVMATLAVEAFAGWLFLISGLFGIAGLFTARNVPGFLWTLLGAVLGILVGALLIGRPLAGVLTLTLLLIGFFVTQGITQIFSALAYRRVVHSWGWVLVSGIADLVLAGIIITGWPGTAAWTLGLLVGINLVMSGLALVMTAVASRSVPDAPEMPAGLRP